MLSRTCRFLHRSGGAAQLLSRGKTQYAGGALNARISDHNLKQGVVQRHFHTSRALPNNKDYYKLLGVTKEASPSEIKKAYYQLAKTHHPDVSKSKNSEKKFQEISEAYEVLGDDSKKKEYDMYGSQGPQNPFGGGHQYHHGRDQGPQMSPEEMFKQAFGGNFDFESMFGNERSSQHREPSISRYQMTISFVEACSGVTRSVQLQYPIKCQRCEGRGGEPGTQTRTCNRCKGTGQTINKVGWYAMQQECAACGGAGTVISQACTGCKGKKTVTKSESAEIKIPAGVNTGTEITYSTAHGVQVAITLQVQKSQVFQRNDLDIMSSVNIGMVTAVIGGKVEIDSLTGKLEVTIPKNTQPGTTLRLAGKGVSGKLTGRGKGHHMLKVNVDIPSNLTRKQQLLFEVYRGDTSNVKELIEMLGGTVKSTGAEKEDSHDNTSSKRSHKTSSASSASDDNTSTEPERKSSWTEFKKRYKTEEK